MAEDRDISFPEEESAKRYFGGVPCIILSDNLKTTVLRHPLGEAPVFHERYMDFAGHHGFTPKACGIHQPQAKGRVESNVGYVKKSLLNGLNPSGLAAVNTAGRLWLDTVANIRMHATTRQTPRERFKNEKEALRPLNCLPYDLGVVSSVGVSPQFRVRLAGNRYSVPATYASSRVNLKRTPDHLWFYHDNKLIADHVRSYDIGQDYLIPDHEKPLLMERRHIRDQRLLQHFLRLSPQADMFYRQLEDRHLNARHHVRQIMALSEHYPKIMEQAAKNQWLPEEIFVRLLDGEIQRRDDRSLIYRVKNARFPFVKTLDNFDWSWPQKINRAQIKAEINTFLKPKLLIIDELGYMPIDKIGADLLFQIISGRYENSAICITSNKAFKQWSSIFNNDATLTSAILDRLIHHGEPVLIEGRSYRMKDRFDTN